MKEIRIEVESLRHGPKEIEFSMGAREFDLAEDPEYKFNEPIVGNMLARLAGVDNVLVTGTLKTVAASECSRCLEPLRIPIHLDVSVVFFPEPEDKHRFEELQDDEKLYYKEGIVRPIEQLREEILLALPMLPGCELEEDDTCPITGAKMGKMVFGEDTPEAPANPKPAKGRKNSDSADAGKKQPKGGNWKDALSDLREQMKKPKP